MYQRLHLQRKYQYLRASHCLFEGLVVGDHRQTCHQKCRQRYHQSRQLDHRNRQSLLGNHRRQRRLLV
ncbi:DUF2116 family Zn-ribbon domain-containing protein [Veillonella sp.]|uniref:DUF2116 family Zn-ribbon domain-containing protein n=1 Tax=Veillonella sp. TaxID=1926307 RepID=UPI003966F907